MDQKLIDNLDVDMFIEQKVKTDNILLEIIKNLQAKIKDYEDLLAYKKEKAAEEVEVSPAGLMSAKAAAMYTGTSEYGIREGAKQGYYHEIPWAGRVYYRKEEIDGYLMSCCKSKLKQVI